MTNADDFEELMARVKTYMENIPEWRRQLLLDEIRQFGKNRRIICETARQESRWAQ